MEKLNNPTPGTEKNLPTLAAMQRAACLVVHSETRDELKACRTGSGGAVAMLIISLPTDEMPELLTVAFRGLMNRTKNVMAWHLLCEDRAATAPGSASQSYINANLNRIPESDTVRWVILLELSVPSESADKALNVLVDDLSRRYSEHGEVVDITFDTYNMLCSVEK